MKEKSHVTRFAELRHVACGDPHKLADDRLRALWVLAAARDDPELAYMTPAQISDILCDGIGIHVSRRRVAGILQEEKGTIGAETPKGQKLLQDNEARYRGALPGFPRSMSTQSGRSPESAS